MQLIAINARTGSSRRMPLTLSPLAAEQKLTGQVLRNLRNQKGMTLRDVASPLGLKPQGWQYYEVGDRKFTPDRVAAVLEILGVSEYDFDAERERVLGSPAGRPAGMGEARSPDFVFDVFGRTRMGDQGSEVYDVNAATRRLDLRQVLGRSIGALEVAGDLLTPWAESGEIVLFDRDRAPRRGKGCVIETKAGEAYVKLYEKSDGSTLFVRELYPQEKTVTYPLKDIKGVYPVVFRGD